MTTLVKENGETMKTNLQAFRQRSGKTFLFGLSSEIDKAHKFLQNGSSLRGVYYDWAEDEDQIEHFNMYFKHTSHKESVSITLYDDFQI